MSVRAKAGISVVAAKVSWNPLHASPSVVLRTWPQKHEAVAVLVLLLAVACDGAQLVGRHQKPPPASWHRQQGFFCLRQRDPQMALSHFRTAVELDPTDAESRDYIGLILGESGML